MIARVRRRIIAGVVVATLLIALNMAALIFGWRHLEIVAPAIILDVGGMGLLFWLAWRESLLVEAVYVSQSKEQRQETEKAIVSLAEAEARYAAILESAMDAVITVDEAQTILVFNGAAESVFGCDRQDAIGAPLTRFIPERFRRNHQVHVESFGNTGVTNRRMGDSTVLWALRSDGVEFPIEASISQTAAAGHRLFTVILRDVTLRKASEDALHQSQAELRELSAQVLQAREDEKTRIARELHDELGQQLTALKMDLAFARERLPAGHPDLADKLARMNATLDTTVTATRRISADLRPLMLDDLGLAEAAEWLVEDFQQRSGVLCTLSLEDPDSISGLSGPIATALYRVLQESLTNVARHAAARTVHIILALETDTALLSVEDDGHGISEEDQRKPRSFGLKGLRERAHYLGGTARIEQLPAGGTRILVRIPLAHGVSA